MHCLILHLTTNYCSCYFQCLINWHFGNFCRWGRVTHNRAFVDDWSRFFAGCMANPQCESTWRTIISCVPINMPCIYCLCLVMCGMVITSSLVGHKLHMVSVKLVCLWWLQYSNVNWMLTVLNLTLSLMRSAETDWYFMVALCNRADHYIFAL